MSQIVSENVVSDNGTQVNKNKKKVVLEWVAFGLFLVAILVTFRFLIAFEVIRGDSMNPTITDGNVLFVSKFFHEPKQGDIVIVEDPDGFSMVKRVIGLPNDTISIQNGIVYINDSELIEDYTVGISPDMGKIELKQDEYFVIGDNRTLGESLDSRDPIIGPITKDLIIGESVFSIFSFGK